jgi:hypothetical protein
MPERVCVAPAGVAAFARGEIVTLARVFAGSGSRKIRLLGGKEPPSVELPALEGHAAGVDRLPRFPRAQFSPTASLLRADRARPVLHAAGSGALTVSPDTLKPRAALAGMPAGRALAVCSPGSRLRGARSLVGIAIDTPWSSRRQRRRDARFDSCLAGKPGWKRRFIEYMDVLRSVDALVQEKVTSRGDPGWR